MTEFGDMGFVCRRRHFLIYSGSRFLIAVLLLANTTQANWWYLGLSSSVVQSTENDPKSNFKDKCSELEVLADHQKEICARAKNVLSVVSRGASMAIEECQYQFRNRRWNCTTFEQKTVFGNILARNSREKAYIYAISSAGVTHSITKACAKGEVQMCSCDLNVRTQQKETDFLWGGCSQDVRFGEKFSKEFVDGRESSNQNLDERLMNSWNNEAGRKAVSGSMKLLCKCHGVSGSCSAKICWRTVASFREIGDLLKDKFDGATIVKVVAAKVKLKPLDRRQKRPTRRDLVYLEQSPDYCDHRPEVGSLGTVGRQCNRTSYGVDGCQLMCCGRGYRTYIEEEVEDCNCKFFWCCSVECQKCSSTVEKYYCN